MAKRISTLNDHEEHILRRRIHTYQKIHHKEIAEVSSQLEEIRESMKALATDPLYGTHALTTVNHDVSQGGPSKAAPTTQKRKFKLRHTHSFPDLLDESGQGSVRENHSSFPAVKGEIYTGARFVVKSGENAVFNGEIKLRSKSVRSSYHAHDSILLGKEGSDMQGKGHKILERSKTAPLAMLQPLLKTTPEMMRKKIHISTSHRLNSEERSTRRGASPRVGEEGHWTHPTHPLQPQADKGTLLHRPKTVRDSHQMKMNLKPASHSLYESKSPRLSRKDHVSAKRAFSRAGENYDTSVKIHMRKSSDKGISTEPFHNFKDDLFDSDEVSDKEGIEDLRNCRYLRFAKESQESNRI